MLYALIFEKDAVLLALNLDLILHEHVILMLMVFRKWYSIKIVLAVG